jgi:hypothetical protein
MSGNQLLLHFDNVAEDSSIYNNLGVANYDADTVSGKLGNALNLDGTNDFVSARDIEKEGDTFSFWAYFPSEVTSSSPCNTLISYGSSSETIPIGSCSSFATSETIGIFAQPIPEDYERTYIRDTISVGWHHLASVIEEVLSLENQRVHMLKVGTKETRFRKEKERMIDLIKGLQKDYLEKGKIEAKVYELKMKSYTRKVSEIDEKLALLEAQTAIRKRKRFFGLLWSKKKILKEGRR